MATLEWGYVFIWIGIGIILLLTGIIISSIRRSWRVGRIARIPNKTMSIFKPGVFSKSLSRQIGEELRSSVRTQTDAMPQAPKSALWGWAPAGSKLGEVNFQAVILSSPQLIEHFAKTHSKGAWARHPTQSMEDYLSLLSRHLPSLDNDDLSGYLLRYNAVRFEEKDVSKRQYSKWLAHLTAILHTLDENALPALETLESEPLNRIIVEKQHKKRKKKRGK